MALSDIVSVTVSLSADKVSRPGFGVPMVLAMDAQSGFTEHVRYYTDMDGVFADFATTTATYKMCNQVFSQSPRPPKLAVGRLEHKPTLAFDLTPIATNSTIYKITVNGTDYSYTSDSSATVAEITAGLVAALGSISGITIADATTKVTLVASAAGGFFHVQVADVSRITIANVTPDVSSGNLAADLAAISAEDPAGWYALLHPTPSSAVIQIVDTFTEAHSKLFIAATQDSNVITLALGSDASTSVAGILKSSAALRTALIYHPDGGAFADCALAGACLPLNPGSETWAFKTLTGVAAVTLTATQRTNAVNKFVTVYETIAGVNVTEVGKVSGNEYIDVIRFRDWLQVNMQDDIFAALTMNAKVAFTDGGISLIQGVIQARLQAGVDAGGLSSSPAPKVTVPLAANISGADKAARTLNGVKFDAVLAGAIQVVNITGVLSA